jgi:hypothetical protein
MASFTDAISQFNPYVQQLPVDLMAKVGMQKQAQYEAGVQKIQQQIDNVAGLEVGNPADKAYLQSKLGQLGNNLKIVAGGDFSNQQLVNSVGGMATDIIKDPIVQTAVSSAAWYKKQEQELQKAYREGKSSIANVQDFYDQAKPWLNSDKPGQSFKGTYSPYIDVQKKFHEIIKTINPSASSDDYAYSQFVDKDGKIRTGDLAAAMTRVTKEGVSRETIENAIRASLTPDDLNQMRIDANYRFRDIETPDQFKVALTTGYDNQLKTLDAQEKALQSIVNSTGNDADKLQAQSALSSIEQTKLKLKNTLEERLSLADKSLQAAKMDLYKDESIFQTANAFSWEKKATQLLTNPALQAKFEQQRQDLDRAQFAQKVKMDNWGMQQDLIKNEQWQKDHELNLEKLYGKGSGFTTYLGEPTKNLALPTTAIQNKIDGYKAAENASLSTLAKAMKTDEAGAMLELEKYKKDPNSLNPQLKRTADVILQSQYEQKILANQLKTAEEEVFQTNPYLRQQKENLDAQLNQGRPLTLTVNGKKVVYTPKEIYNYVSKYKLLNTSGELYQSGQDVPLSGSTGVDSKKLSAKERILDDVISKRSSINSDARIMLNQQIGAYTQLGNSYGKLSKDINSKVNETLSKKFGEFIPSASAIVTPTAESKALYASIADAAASKYSMEGLGIKGGSALLSVDDAKKVKQWTSSKDKDNLTFKKLNYAGEQHLVVSKDGEEIIIPLSNEEVNSLPKLKGESNRFNEDIYRIQFGNGSSLSTNPTGKVEDSYYQKWKLPNIKNAVVFADLNADHADPNFQYLSINVKGKDGKMYPMTINTAMNASDADGFIRSMTDNKLKELYMTSPAWRDQVNNIF